MDVAPFIPIAEAPAVEFPLPGQTADKPAPVVPKDTGAAISREASHLMRQGATSTERPAAAAHKDGNAPLYFDPVKGWYAKDASNKAVPYQAGSKPYYDAARGAWVTSTPPKTENNIKHLDVPPAVVTAPRNAQTSATRELQAPTAKHPATVELHSEKAATHPVARELPQATTTAHPVARVARELSPAIDAGQPTRRELPPVADAVRVGRELSRATDAARPVADDLYTKAAQVISHLPENMQLKFQGKSVAIEADVSKLIDALPFIQISDKGREIASHVRGIRLDGNRVTMDLKDNFALPIRNESMGDSVNGLVFGNGQRQVSFDAVFDKSGERVTLRNISGVAIDAVGGRRLGLHELTLNAHRENPTLSVTYDNPKKTVPLLRRFASDESTTTVPLASLDRNLSVDSVRAAMSTIDDVRNALVNRDSMSLTKGLRDRDLRKGIQEVLGTIQTATKNGDTFEITRGGGPAALPLGASGSEVIVGQSVRFKTGNDKFGPTVSSIQGIDMRVPMLGSGSELRMTLKGLSVGVDSRGNKVVKVHSD